MNNENNFPSIKPVKLKEEQKENDLNNNINKVNENITKCKNKNFLNLLSCFSYFFFFILILSIFALNYYYTKNAFNENKNIILPADRLCQNAINSLNSCLNKNDTNFYKCSNENKKLENCYEEAHTFNQKCYIFISELELCYRKNKFKKESNVCKGLENDLNICSSRYRQINIKEIKIKDLFTLKL